MVVEIKYDTRSKTSNMAWNNTMYVEVENGLSASDLSKRFNEWYKNNSPKDMEITKLKKFTRIMPQKI